MLSVIFWVENRNSASLRSYVKNVVCLFILVKIPYSLWKLILESS